MRKLYNEYFHISEKGILREKVFFAHIAVSVVCIVLCMAALGFNAYAFFTSEVTSSMNVIKSANYDLTVEAKDSSNKVIEPSVPTVQSTETNSGVSAWTKTYALEAGTYTFVLTKSGDASTGYAKIQVGNDEPPFFTKQIGGVVDENKEEITSRTVSIRLEKGASVWITSCWGTYAGNASDKDLISDGCGLVYSSDGVLSEENIVSKAKSASTEGEAGSDASSNNAEPTENTIQGTAGQQTQQEATTQDGQDTNPEESTQSGTQPETTTSDGEDANPEETTSDSE